MKKMSVMLPVIMALVMAAAMPVHAKEDKIQTGIYVNDMNLSGMTIEEARQTVQSYVDSFGGSQITLHAVEEGTIVTTASELGLKWGNEGILQEAARFGRDGDILQCYKELKDLEYQNKVYDVAFDFDKDKIRALIEENGAQYNQEAV
ncbi:MAG: hypothetical protein HFI61_08930, partial [Lachnospiraceae bacterium]|nr:hypothetical protein [Lachnospiraceae bacterium]